MTNCLGSCAACVCCSCLCCQCNFAIFPSPRPSYRRDSTSISYFQNSKGNKVPYLNLQKQNSKVNIIYFHGNAEDIGYSTDFVMPMLEEFNASVYAIQYKSYGTYEVSFPALISNTIKSDALEFYDFLKKSKTKFNNQSKTVIIGRSIGSGGATYLASHKNVDGLVLISPFSTIPNVAQDFVGCLGCIVKCHFDNLQQIKNYKNKLLVIHGKQDEVIAFRHGKMVVDLYNKNTQNIGRPCVFVASEHMSHNYFNYQVDILGSINSFVTSLREQK